MRSGRTNNFRELHENTTFHEVYHVSNPLTLYINSEISLTIKYILAKCDWRHDILYSPVSSNKYLGQDAI